MLDRDVVEEFLQEELADAEIDLPSDIDLKALTETFCDYVEDDTYEWLKDNFKLCIEKGVYGGIRSSGTPKSNHEAIPKC